MKQIDKIKNYLSSRKWIYKGHCNCGGASTDKFELQTSNGEYKIKYRNTYFLISTPTENYKRYSVQELKPIVDEIFRKNFQEEDKV